MTASVVCVAPLPDGRFSVVFSRSDGSFRTVKLDRDAAARLASDADAAADLLRKVAR
jgi:hypothetical protein